MSEVIVEILGMPFEDHESVEAVVEEEPQRQYDSIDILAGFTVGGLVIAGMVYIITGIIEGPDLPDRD